MKTPFSRIGELLKDPLFELHHFGREAIAQRMIVADQYAATPDNLVFIDWNEEPEEVEYSFFDTEIGRLLIANTSEGVCFVGFACQGDCEIINDFTRRFPKQNIIERRSALQQLAADYCNGNDKQNIHLHLKGTDYQMTIWRQLVRIPAGSLSAYGSLIGNAVGAQAVGSAVGANPVSYIVPCHRIVRSDGNYIGYHWGSELKKQLLAYEFLAG